MITVQPIASSSAGNALTVGTTDGGPRLLLDAGLQRSQLQAATGYALARLDGALITHEHQDHARAVPDLLRLGVTVYATPGTHDALGTTGHHRAVALQPLQRHDLPGGWRVLPIPAHHDARQPVAYLISGHGARILYATDTGWLDYRVPGITHALIETNWSRDLIDAAVQAGRTPASLRDRIMRSHLGLHRAIALLQAAGTRDLIETHLLHLSDGHSDAEQFATAVRRATGRPALVAARSPA